MNMNSGNTTTTGTNYQGKVVEITEMVSFGLIIK
jgi:hypothetical protein